MSLADPQPSSAALVTGASAGIGTEIARELARRGHGLVLMARRKEKLDQLAAELRSQYGVRAEAVGCDLGVTVTALAPGPVSTEFWDEAGWVAGGQSFESAMPRPAWVTAAEAAQAGVKGLTDGRRVVIPGLQVRTAMLAARYLPNAVKLPAVEWVMRRR